MSNKMKKKVKRLKKELICINEDYVLLNFRADMMSAQLEDQEKDIQVLKKGFLILLDKAEIDKKNQAEDTGD